MLCWILSFCSSVRFASSSLSVISPINCSTSALSSDVTVSGFSAPASASMSETSFSVSSIAFCSASIFSCAVVISSFSVGEALVLSTAARASSTALIVSALSPVTLLSVRSLMLSLMEAIVFICTVTFVLLPALSVTTTLYVASTLPARV